MPFWQCTCFRPKTVEHTPVANGPTKLKHEPSSLTHLDADATDELSPGRQAIGTHAELRETPSELERVIQEWQQNRSLEGQSLRQVQALWDRDQQAILRSLSGSIEVREVLTGSH